ncbi:TlpA disulfide reductase family protein [Constantimarinum furrinae]|uniref:Thioredoxin n=1 Tax=Constantimarinum furrinae TaxID=2562285 RepID=A0A7G8PV34_9FLAO|nr:TlpA disulfide reductase family protein [Constantimarinum furrinae]QNJ98200.1 thioredoxin [Constantimarinum furrinae]
MKFTYLLLLFMVFQACVEGKETPSEEAEVSEEIDKAESYTNTDGKIAVYNFEGLEPEFSKSNDTTYIVNFWATWCKPCIKELPYFEEINSKYSEDKVKVMLVSLDDPKKLDSQLLPFVEKHQLNSTVVLLDDPAANTWIPMVSPEWSGSIPATLMIKNGARKFYERSFTYNELETELKTIL